MKLTYTLTLEGLGNHGWRKEESRLVELELHQDCEAEATSLLAEETDPQAYQEAIELLEDPHVTNDKGRWEIDPDIFHQRQDFRWNMKLEMVDHHPIKNPVGGTTTR